LSGVIFSSFFSTSRTDFPLANPVRFATLKTCVSTAMVGSPKASFNTTFAVFLPTPGSSSKSSLELGIFPLCFSIKILQVLSIFFALVGANPIRLISWVNSFSPILIKDCGPGFFLKREGVTSFTTLSVAWALRITAISSSKL
jgi:hypothetical protein